MITMDTFINRINNVRAIPMIHISGRTYVKYDVIIKFDVVVVVDVLLLSSSSSPFKRQKTHPT